MKKLILLIVAISFLSEAHAQLGVRMGTNIATFHYPEEPFYLEIKSIIGFNIGALYEKQLSDNFSLQGELHFIQKGAKEEDPDFDEEYWLRLNYIDFAIMSKYYLINIEESMRLYLGVTPYLGYALSAKIGEEYEGRTFTNSINFEEENVKRLDFGIGFGLGLTRNNWFLDVRYNIGFQDLDESGEFDFFPLFGQSVYNRGILIGIGYHF